MPKRKLSYQLRTSTPTKRVGKDTHTPPLNKHKYAAGKRLGKAKQIRDRVILKQNASCKTTKKWTTLLASLNKKVQALETKIAHKPTIFDVRMHDESVR